MHTFLMFACLLQISLQLDYIQVQWNENEVFLSTGQSLQLQVSTVNVRLTCSYPINYASWTFPTIGDRIRMNSDQTLSISIFRLAESGNYTCLNNTQQTVVIELRAIGTGIFHIENGNDLSLPNGFATFEPDTSLKAYICLSSLDQLNAGDWYFPNGSRIDNKVESSTIGAEGISVFDALSNRGVYRLMLNGSFDMGLYQCRVNNSFLMLEAQNLYIYTNGTGYISVEYEEFLTQIVNNTLYIPIGTTQIKLTCSIPNSTWTYPPTSQYATSQSVGNSLSLLQISLFTLGEVGTYQCVGEQTVTVMLKSNGSAIVVISQGDAEQLNGHEVLTYTGYKLEVLCLSSSGVGMWYHPIMGRIESEISRENGSIELKQNISIGVVKLVFEGELSSRDEGVYQCGISGQENLLSVGIYNGIDYITVASYPSNFQVYNGQFLSLTPARQSVVLSCPYPNAIWSVPANSNSSSCPLTDGRIYISQLNEDTEGVYTCRNTPNITSITLLQDTQQLVITVNGEIYNQSSLTINSCARPIYITCSTTNSVFDTPLKWYNSISREIVSYSTGNATIDTSVFRAEDSGIYTCATDTLGYATTTNLQLLISEVNYIQLDYESRTIPLVDGQKVKLDIFTLAVFLTCKGAEPHWSNYPISNYTRLSNSTDILFIEIFSLNSTGEYVCTDNTTGDSTTVTIGYSKDIYQITSDGSYTPINEAVLHIEQFAISLDLPTSSAPLVPYGTQGVKISCSLEGYVRWNYPYSVEYTDGVCLIEGGILIRNISSETRGIYTCANNEQNVSISLLNIIHLTENNSTKYITGREDVYIDVLSRNITLTCDSPNAIWLIQLDQSNSTQIISTDYNSLSRQINGTSIEVNRSITIGHLGILESGYYVCDPSTSRQTLVYLQSIGLALFINFSSTPSRIQPNSIFLLSPTQNLSFSCLYGTLHQPPTLIHTNLSNATTQLSTLVQTQLNLIKLQLDILFTPEYIDDYESRQRNAALNGRYSCSISSDNFITFTVYHIQTVTPRIRFYRNSSPVSLRLIRTPYNDSTDLLECRADFIEASFTADSIGWWLNGIPITSNDPILNISSLQTYIGSYECRVYSRFANTSKTVNITILKVPFPPLNLTAIEVYSGLVTLSWMQSEFSYGMISSYLIEYTFQPLDPDRISNSTISFTTSYNLTSLTPNSVYTFTVRARNIAGFSPPSDSITFRTLPIVPSAPESLSYSELTVTSVQLTWTPPRENSETIILYQISTKGFKSYDPLFEDELDPIIVNASSLWLQLDDLAPATYYYVNIIAVGETGTSVESETLCFATPPGELSVERPIVVTTPLRGLDSIVVSLEETSNRNAEIIYQLLLMVRLPLDYDTDTFEINPLLSTLDLSRTPREVKEPLSIIQLSFVANISSYNCYAFPIYFIVGVNSEFNTCELSNLENKLKVSGSNVYTNFFPELQFGFQYAFALIAVTREMVFYNSEISNFIELLEPVNDGIEGIIYISATLGAAVILFAVIIAFCCFILCCVVNFYTKPRKTKLKRRDSYGLPAMETSMISAKNNLGFCNPLVTTENGLTSSELTDAMQELSHQSYSTKSGIHILVEDLGERINFLHKNCNEAFSQDYNQLNERLESEAKAAKEHCNRHLNRFVDVFPYDDSRVVLTPIPDFHKYDHDYINASFINGYEKERSFIVTQAPLLDTICDFLRLCWEYNITVIAYFTDAITKARISSYWPENVTIEAEFGPFIIKLTEIIIHKTYIRRTLSIKHQVYPDETRVVHQFHFTSWPDTGLPEISALLNFHTLVRSFYASQDQSGPLLVHCRSGTGPSAVFLFLDIALEQARTENRINIQKIINSMRSMRAKMMCSLDYYTFSHDILLTALTCGDTCIDAPFIPRYIKQLLDTDNQTHSDGYHSEFNILQQISIPTKDYPRTIALQHASRNRNKDFLPINSRIFKLEQSNYINATFINGYSSDNSFIIAESPMEHTVDNFWHLIFESRCQAVVMLCELAQEQTDVCAKYWIDSGEPVTYGHLTVQLSNIIHPEHGAFIIHTFVLTSTKSKDLYLEVKQYIYKDWDKNYLPTNYSNFVKLITQVLKGYHGQEDRNPVIVHCSDTVGRCGVFCSALYCIERLIEENSVDVFGCVRYLRRDKPELVNTETYYKSIYQTILSYIST